MTTDNRNMWTELGIELTVPDEAQTVGAPGAAVLAEKRGRQQEKVN